MIIATEVNYANSMGIDPSFVTALVKKGPDQINILSHDQLVKYKIITNPTSTEWEIKALAGKFYLLGTTHANNGLHKMIFICNGKEALLFSSSTT